MAYIPEQDSFSINFQNAGYETFFFLLNAASSLGLIWVHIVVSILLLIIFSAVSRCHIKGLKQRKSVQNYLFWSGSIRMFIEAYLDLVLFSLLNITSIYWPDGLEFVLSSNWMSYVIYTLCVIIPLVLLAFMCYKTG